MIRSETENILGLFKLFFTTVLNNVILSPERSEQEEGRVTDLEPTVQMSHMHLKQQKPVEKNPTLTFVNYYYCYEYLKKHLHSFEQIFFQKATTP